MQYTLREKWVWKWRGSRVPMTLKRMNPPKQAYFNNTSNAEKWNKHLKKAFVDTFLNLNFTNGVLLKMKWMSYSCCWGQAYNINHYFGNRFLIWNYGIIWTKYQRLSRILLHIINFRSFAPTSSNVYCKRVSWCYC